MTQLSLITETAPPVNPLPVNTDPWKQYDGVTLYHGDNLDILRAMPANSVDSGVTDSPYGLGFMGKEWDTFTPEKIKSDAAMKQRKNQDDLAELQNVYGRKRSPAQSPSQIEYDRSLNGQRSFQLWCEAWARELYRVLKPGAHLIACGAPRSSHRMVCGIEDAGFEIRDSIAWLFGQGFPKSYNLDGDAEGWGTALKPAHEPIVVARKPFNGDTTTEQNMRVWGVGALNIERCTLEDGDRWPPNAAMDADVARALDEQTGTRRSGANPTRRHSPKFERIFERFQGQEVAVPARAEDFGGPSRYFFCPKPSRAERDFGCDDLPMNTAGECTDRKDGSAGMTPYAGAGRSGGGRNPHPTVKPVNLMRWLIQLVTPAGGIVVDPFLGSGTTGMAAVVDGYQFIGIEKCEKDDTLLYLRVSDARISATLREVRG